MMEVNKLNWSEIVSIVNDPNKCSGLHETIKTVLHETMLPSSSLIVEVGSNTGFSSIEFALRRPDCRVVGIDINEKSVRIANEKAKKYGLDNLTFYCADITTKTFFDNCSIDLLFVSNVSSFIENKKEALTECDRILKQKAYFCAVPIWYHLQPPIKLKQQVEKLINTSLKDNSILNWLQLFELYIQDLNLLFREDYRYIIENQSRIDEYVEDVFNNFKIEKFSKEEESKLKKRFSESLTLFNENLRYCSYSILIYRKTMANRSYLINSGFKVSY